MHGYLGGDRHLESRVCNGEEAIVIKIVTEFLGGFQHRFCCANAPVPHFYQSAPLLFPRFLDPFFL